MGAVEPKFDMDGGLPVGGIPLPSEQAQEDAEAAIKKLVSSRDTSLEAKFDIPADAIVQDNLQSRKQKAQEEADAMDSIFGLPGGVVRIVKQGTWACLALLVAAEVFARTPLADSFRAEGRNEQEELQKRREKSTKGEKPEGVRPLKPYVFGDLPEAPPGIENLPGNM